MKGLEQIVDISIDLKAPLITIWVLPILLYYHYTTTILLYYCYYATILCYCYYIVLLCLLGPVEKERKTNIYIYIRLLYNYWIIIVTDGILVIDRNSYIVIPNDIRHARMRGRKGDPIRKVILKRIGTGARPRFAWPRSFFLHSHSAFSTISLCSGSMVYKRRCPIRPSLFVFLVFLNVSSNRSFLRCWSY